MRGTKQNPKWAQVPVAKSLTENFLSVFHQKSDSNEDNSGNWKRRKVDNKNNEVNGGKKYDPEETLDESMEEFTSETSVS